MALLVLASMLQDVHDPAGFAGSIALVGFIVVLVAVLALLRTVKGNADDIRKGHVDWDKGEFRAVRGRYYNDESEEWEDWY